MLRTCAVAGNEWSAADGDKEIAKTNLEISCNENPEAAISHLYGSNLAAYRSAQRKIKNVEPAWV